MECGQYQLTLKSEVTSTTVQERIYIDNILNELKLSRNNDLKYLVLEYIIIILLNIF